MLTENRCYFFPQISTPNEDQGCDSIPSGHGYRTPQAEVTDEHEAMAESHLGE
jgi:hypothetical protein